MGLVKNRTFKMYAQNRERKVIVCLLMVILCLETGRAKEEENQDSQIKRMKCLSTWATFPD